MKKSVLITIVSIMLCSGFGGSAQNLYTLDLKNTETFTVDCGDVTPSQWSVKNNHCSLTTTPVIITGEPGVDMIVPLTITLSSTGNLDCGEVFPDGAFIRYSVNSGYWYAIRRITACQVKNKITVTACYVVCAAAGSTISIKVSLATNAQTEKIWVKNGDILIGVPVAADTTNWYYKLVKSDMQTQQAEISADEITLYPNPANDLLFLEIANADVSGYEKLSIYNTDGQLVHQQAISEQKTEINIALLPKGLFFVKVKKGEKFVIKRFVK